MSLEIKTYGQDTLSLLSSWVTFFATAEIGGWLVSLSGLHISQLSSLAILAISAIVALLVSRRVKGDIPPPNDKPDSTVRLLARPIIVAALLVFIFQLGNAYIKEDLSWDGNVYHLPTIGLWNQHGSIYWIDEPFHSVDLMNGYPKGAELFTYLLCKASGNSAWLNAQNLFFLPLGVIGIALLSQLMGASRYAAWCVSAFYILLPVNICQSPTTYVDSAYASCAIAAIAIWIHCWRGCLNIRTACIMGACLGLAISIKQTGLILMAGTFLLIVIRLIQTRNKKWQTICLYVACILLCAFLVGGGWYLRNWIIANSPLYPAGMTLFGWKLFPGQTVAEMIGESICSPTQIMGLPPVLKIMRSWLPAPSTYPYTIAGCDARLGGLGVFWMLAGVPAILATAIYYFRTKSKFFLDFTILSVWVLFMFFCTPMNWWARYTVWIYALGLPCLAIWWDKIQLRGILKIWMACNVLILLFEGSVCLIYVAVFEGIPATQGHYPSTDKQASTLPLFPELALKFNAVISSGRSVALGPLSGDNCQLTGNLLAPLGKRMITTLTQDVNSEIIRQLKRQGFDFIIWDKHYELNASLLQNTSITAEASRFYLLHIVNL